MSDENKDLRDDLEDMLGSAKEKARKAAGKAEEFGHEAKEKAKEFAGKAKEEAKEFAEEAKEVLSDGKNVAIIAHIHLIGWIIALVMNSSNKNEFASFYIRQMLGIIILSLFVWIPVIGWILGILILIMWIMSLINAIGGKMKPVFLLGNQFQDWFKSL